MNCCEVSVVVPTCARPSLLEKAVKSITLTASAAKLEGEALEIIVADDGHCNESRSLCERFRTTVSHPLTYLRTRAGPREGPGATRNQGVWAARGRFIYFIDDDDQFLENRFERSLPFLRSGEVDAVFERSLRKFTDGSGRPSFIHGPDGHSFSNATELMSFMLSVGEKGHISQAATALTKEIFEEIGGFDETLRYGQDGEFLLRLAALARVAPLSGEAVAADFIHGSNNTRQIPYHTSIRMLRVLYKNLKKPSVASQRAVVRRAIRGKLDFILTMCRLESLSYYDRVKKGMLVIWHYPWSCLDAKNVKSIAVWLSKGRTAGISRGKQESVAHSAPCVAGPAASGPVRCAEDDPKKSEG